LGTARYHCGASGVHGADRDSGRDLRRPNHATSVLHNGILALFPDYTIPALALGAFCGGAALVTLVAVFARPQLGALAALVAGAFMIAFELVEILVVGFTPLQTPDQFPAWL
jgi:hypothetical protein